MHSVRRRARVWLELRWHAWPAREASMGFGAWCLTVLLPLTLLAAVFVILLFLLLTRGQ